VEYLIPKWTSYIPHLPHPKQHVFLLMDQKEVFFGGAAGGGKSDALLMGALQYVDVPGYNALILRKSFAELSKPEALMDRAQEWLIGTDAHWSGDLKTWKFPSGATISFGYIDNNNDRFQFQSSAYQYIGWDELTEWPDDISYRWLFSRLRRLEGCDVPLRVRAASNPGGLGHDWVRRRFVDNPRRIFIPSRLSDNPSLDALSYIDSLGELDEVTIQQLLNGDWTARLAGTKFRREWFDGKYIDYDRLPVNLKRVRYWDLAATEPGFGKDPCYTVGLYLAEDTTTGYWYIVDVQRFRATPFGVEQRIRRTADMDGDTVYVKMEQEPGASGVNTIDNYARRVLRDRHFSGHKPSGDKEVRANPVSSKCEKGLVYIVRGGWNDAFLDELEAFPNGVYKDQVDAFSGAFVTVGSTSGTVQVTKTRPDFEEPVVRRGDLTLRGERYIDKK